MMKRLMATLAALTMPLTLGSCFITPGHFESTLDLRRDGTFSFAYKGEIVFQSPEALMKMGESADDGMWKGDKAVCYKESDAGAAMDAAADAASNGSDKGKAPGTGGKGATASEKTSSAKAEAAPTDDSTDAAVVDEGTRPCTPKEIAEQKKDWEDAKRAREDKAKKDAAQFGAIFGYTPGDDAANQKLATTIMRYEGWKSVIYKGDGVFAVDYELGGRLDHDFVFPLLPQSDLVFPFVVVKRQTDGAARVAAPALIGGGIKALAARMRGIGAAITGKDVPTSARTKGSFALTTDGEILTNNTEDGATKVPTGLQLLWTIGPDSEKVPEALVNLR